MGNRVKVIPREKGLQTLCVTRKQRDVVTTHFFYKQHFYKYRQVEIGKKLSKS